MNGAVDSKGPHLVAPILAAVALYIGMAFPAAAAELSVGEIEAQAGGVVRLAVTLDRAAGEAVSGVQTNIDFDPDIFSFDSAMPGEAIVEAEKQLNSNLVTPGRVRLLIAGLNLNTIDDGEIATLVLKVDADALPGEYRIDVNDVVIPNLRGQRLRADAVDGTIRLTADDPAAAAEEPSTGCCYAGAASSNAGSYMADVAALLLVVMCLIKWGRLNVS